MLKKYKKILNKLSNEQLIYLIERLNYSLCLISEACVNESKCHIDSNEAIEKIRGYIYDIPNLYDVTKLEGYIDMKMENIPVEDYRKMIGLD